MPEPAAGLRVVGAGFPRTGTTSLRAALERLLDGPCYHMREFFHRPEHGSAWRRAAEGDPTDAMAVLDGFAACVDTPACLLWKPLAQAHPDAIVLLSRRSSAETWYASADATVMRAFRAVRAAGDGVPDFWTDETPERRDAMRPVFGWIDRDLWRSCEDPDVAMAAYDAWLDDVRAKTPPDRLLEWQPGDGWEPLCQALGVAVPDEPFPHANTREEFVARKPRGR